MAVIEALRRTGHPMTHAEVAASLGGRWDRATIFRNLVALADADFVRRTDLGDHVWRFEIAAPPQGAHDHPHFLCTQCGAVACVPALDLRVHRGARVPRAVRARAIEVQLRGVCDACA
jgi:Fur family ferric uptake transcriptional regulator